MFGNLEKTYMGSVPVTIRCKHLKCMVMCEELLRKVYLKNVGIMSAWKKNKGKTSKFVDAGSNNWNESEGNESTRKKMEKKIKLKLYVQFNVETLIHST